MEVQLSAFKVVCVLYLFSFILGVSSQSVPLCGSDPLKNFTVVETTLNGNVANIVWLNQQDVFLLTDKYIAYHSQDGGASWENINPTLGISSGGIDQLYANADSSAIYLVGQVSNLWIYTPGASYQQVQIPSIALLQPHPVEPLFCVAYTTNLDLYITSNQFNNYTKVAPQVAYGDWGSGLTYYYVANDASGSLMVVKGDSSPQLVDTNIRGLAAAGDLLFIAKPVTGNDSALQLFSSTNLGEGPWVKARFPVDVEENYYVIFGISVGSVIIGVIHEGLTNANLYMSDSLDADFVMVLPNIAFHTYDISGSHVYLLECRVLQVQGAIIANQYLGTNSQTVISFDNGGRWQPLTPPSGCTNEANCGVQLHITYKVENAPFGPLHTRASAVGLILGTGNIGTTLNNTLAGTSTFFTRTEGAQWTQIAQQSTMYEFADHGALMVVADNINPTNILSYSWNEALSFVQCQFTQNQLAIAGIVVEPTATSQSFLLYGQRQDSTTALVFLDFSTLHQRVCDESDYEIWSVLDGVCVLGQKVTYKRRKQTSECYNPDDFDAEQTTEICPCQPYDYECDYCFELEGTICKAVCSTFNNTCVDGKMTVSQGYRLVPGTKCNVTSGLDRLPITTSCPATSSNPNHGKSSGTPTNVIAAVVSVLIGVALIAAGVYLWKNDRTRRWVEDRVSWGRYKVLGKNESGSLLINQDENFSLDDEFDHDSDAPILNDDAIVHFSETSSPVK